MAIRRAPVPEMDCVAAIWSELCPNATLNLDRRLEVNSRGPLAMACCPCRRRARSRA